MALKAVTVGGAMIDVVVVVASNRIERMTLDNAGASYLLLEAGRKIESKGISRFFGGGAINAAVSMTRLGADCDAFIKLGSDAEAERVIDHLRGESVGVGQIMRHPELATGSSVLIASHDRNMTIFTYRGANTAMAEADLDTADFAADLVYVTTLSNESAARFPGVVSRARAAGAMTAANPGIRQITARGAEVVQSLADIDILNLNRVESAALIPALVASGAPSGGVTAGDLPSLSSGGFAMPLRGYMRAVLAQGPRWVVMTDGGRGAYLAGGGLLRHCPAAPAQARGTVGAGDAYSSTLALMLTEGIEPDRAMRAAALNAASVVEAVDAQSGLLTHEALDTRAAGSVSSLPVARWELE